LRYSLCMSIARLVSELVRDAVLRLGCDTLLLSGGIDTSFIALSTHDLIRYAVTVALSRDAPDIKYARLVSNSLGIKHYVITLEGSSNLRAVINEYLSKLLPIIRTIDPIEVVCDLPLYVGIEFVKDMGSSCLVTGDGGDELFLGYEFLLSRSKEELRSWIKKVIDSASFSSVSIGEALGIRVLTGFYIRSVKYVALATPTECCINEISGALVGKYLLRSYLAFNGLVNLALRRKLPVMYGSGFNELLSMWGREVSVGDVITLGRRYRIKLPSRAHAYLLKKLIQLGIDVPDKCDKEELRCPICGSCLTNGFCRFCGAYLSNEGITSHYSDEVTRVWSKIRLS